MTTHVIDASIAVKWVVEEDGTPEALALLRGERLLAPDLLVPECANVLWKKVQMRELGADEALVAARVLQGAEIELVPTRSLLEATTRLAIELVHPAYDCVYLALALAINGRFVTADKGFVRRVMQSRQSLLRDSIAPLVGR